MNKKIAVASGILIVSIFVFTVATFCFPSKKCMLWKNDDAAQANYKVCDPPAREAV